MEDMAPTNSPEGEGACRIEALLGSLGVWEFRSLGVWKFGSLEVWEFGSLGVWTIPKVIIPLSSQLSALNS